MEEKGCYLRVTRGGGGASAGAEPAASVITKVVMVLRLGVRQCLRSALGKHSRAPWYRETCVPARFHGALPSLRPTPFLWKELEVSSRGVSVLMAGSHAHGQEVDGCELGRHPGRPPRGGPAPAAGAWSIGCLLPEFQEVPAFFFFLGGSTCSFSGHLFFLFNGSHRSPSHTNTPFPAVLTPPFAHLKLDSFTLVALKTHRMPATSTGLQL